MFFTLWTGLFLILTVPTVPVPIPISRTYFDVIFFDPTPISEQELPFTPAKLAMRINREPIQKAPIVGSD